MSKYMWEWRFKLLFRRYKGLRWIGIDTFTGQYYVSFSIKFWWGFISVVMEKKSVPRYGGN